MMLGALSAVLLCLLLPQVNGITTDAKCLAGYEWTFSSIGQSPCDVAAELASVCSGGQFNLEPLDTGYVYAGPTPSNQNSCRCSSVYYSLVSACGYCQGRSYVGWSTYSANCTTVYVPVYTQEIPAGVKVPAYAYLNVSVSDMFNVTLAASVHGTESSRPSPSVSAGSGGHKNTGPIVGGVVGGIAFLGIVSVLVAFLIVRSRRKRKSPKHSSSFRPSPNMAFTPSTMATLLPTTPPEHAKIYDPNDPSTYPAVDPNFSDPYRQQSPPLNSPHYTGNSAQHSLPPQTMPQNTGGHSHYTGVPEV